MCTLIAAVGQFPGYPLVVAANRDEALARPSSGPRLWPGALPFVAPRDEQAGGTWLGVNARGLFVGITNRFLGPRDQGRGSRGALVTSALARPDAAAVHQALGDFDPRTVNAFHLLYADRSGTAGVTWTDGQTLTQERLSPGLHIVTERSFGAALAARVDVVKERWPRPDGDGPDLAGLKALLAHHHPEDPFASLCIHAPAFDYGTRSSTILLLGSEPSRSRLWITEGPPCQSPWSDRTALLNGLFAPPIAPGPGSQ